MTQVRAQMLYREHLHDQRKVLKFCLQYGNRAAGHFNAAGSIEGRLRRNAIAPAHEKYLQQFGGLARIDQTALQQIVP